MPDKLPENRLDWTLEQIVNQCREGIISTEQVTKMIDRKAEVLKEKTKLRIQPRKGGD